MAEPDDSFIARWSRRKRGDSAEPDATGPAPVQAETGESTEADPTQDEIVDQLPDIDSLDENADFTVFLKKGVPEELRKRALRRLWRLNPVFANLDGLNDYDEDFTAAATMLEGLKTVYQVGKGMPGTAEPQTGEAEAGEIETSPAPAGDKAARAGDDEPHEADNKSERQQIAEAEVTPVADQGEQVRLPEENETASVLRPDSGTRPASGRSAAERRWGRLES